MIARNLPNDVNLEIFFFIGGVTFDDGTIQRNLSNNDVEDTGEYTFRIVMTPASYGSVCHSISRAFQSGVTVGQRY